MTKPIMLASLLFVWLVGFGFLVQGYPELPWLSWY